MKLKCPFGEGWVYVSVQMRGGSQHRLWRNKKTKELKWETL